MENYSLPTDTEFDWNTEKNSWLFTHRGLRFEDAIKAMATGGLLEIVTQPATSRYPNQKIFVIDIGGYAHLVPFVEYSSGYFLKTISPSRRATRKYLRH